MLQKRWFRLLTKIDENKWDYKINSLPKNIVSDMGSFNQYSLKELHNITKNYKENNNNIPIIVRVRASFIKENLFDTSALQYYGEAHAMYQVASNFNCQEVSSVYKSVFSGNYLTNLMTDSTQGPSASGGAGLGAILRVAIHKNNKINLLDKTNLKPKNGKLYADKSMPNVSLESIKIGLHIDVKANYIRSSDDYKYNPNALIIDQVFTSTCICNKNIDKSIPAIFLKASYDATYLCAVYRQSPSLVLTLIGGNSFSNPHDQIVNALISAHNKYSRYLSPNCKVILPIYTPNSNCIVDIFKSHPNVVFEDVI